MRVLLTGASGFVGKATLAALLRRGAEVAAVSRSKPSVDGTYLWWQVDLLDYDAMASVIAEARPDIIVHLAWYVETGKFWNAPENLDWVAATLALARAAAAAGARRFVATGTCVEYRWPDNGACNETTTPLAPLLLYGVAKDATHRLLSEFCRVVGMDLAWARIFLMYGPDEDARRLVASVANAIAAGEPARCSSGRVIRDFMDVRDTGEALVALALSGVTGAVNVGSGEAIKVADVALTLGRLSGRPDLVQLGSQPDREDEPPCIVADVGRLYREVGFRPSHTLEQGLSDALDRSRQSLNKV